MHEVLQQLQNNGGDPDVTNGLTDVVQTMDDSLMTQNSDQTLDDCSYAYIYREDPLPFNAECLDDNGEWQNVQALLKNDPFDWIKNSFSVFQQ